MPIPSLEPGQDGGFNLADWGGSSGLDDDAFEAIGQTVQHAAGAIDGLKDILERLQNSVAQATEQRRNDIEIGQLFTRAQDFVEGAVTEAHALAQRIIADAEFEAARIITAAKEEAQRLIEDARHSASLPSDVVRALQATIGEFGRMNNVLVRELSALTQALDVERDSAPAISSASAGTSGAEFDHVPSFSPSSPQSLSTESGSAADQQAEGGAVDAPVTPQPSPSSPSGYWGALRPGKQPDAPRLGRHTAPGTRWRTC